MNATVGGAETPSSSSSLRCAATIHVQRISSTSSTQDRQQADETVLGPSSRGMIDEITTPWVEHVASSEAKVANGSSVTREDSKGKEFVPVTTENGKIKSEHNDHVTNGTRHQVSKTSNGLRDYEERIFSLKEWQDMPEHLQFNPHICSGYRPITSVRGCIAGLFYVHNETVNIFTHGIPIVYILWVVPGLLPWGSQGPLALFLSWCHLLGAVSPWIGSFTYHLFMNSDQGDPFYQKLLKLDMLGIWICQSIGAVPMIAISSYCLPDALWWCCIFIYCNVSIYGLHLAMNAYSPWERRLCFAPPFTMRMLMLMLRIFGVAGGSPNVMLHLVLQDLYAVAGGVVGALHIPEKWFPGKVDFILNSHNIMHVLVVMAVHSMHIATLQDLAWMSNADACIALNSPVVNIHEEL